jgi:hypothetical protein
LAVFDEEIEVEIEGVKLRGPASRIGMLAILMGRKDEAERILGEIVAKALSNQWAWTPSWSTAGTPGPTSGIVTISTTSTNVPVKWQSGCYNTSSGTFPIEVHVWA